jgi:D-lactate dehydrogenase
MSPDYPSVIRELQQSLGADRVQDSYHRRFAHSTDASYFRIVPEVVVEANTLEQVKQTLAIARRHGAPVTFRAAGTSLSGQAVGPGILLKLGYDGFDTIRVSDDHGLVTLGVAVIGAQANSVLKPLDKKIGPDPATLTSAKIGGIVANNSSGMCCGTAQNSYNTIHSAKLLFADGTHLDTASEASRAAFASGHGALLDALQALAQRTQSNEALAARIRKKFSIKNTTGYSLNALVDFTDPFDLINHLIVGSEGTLAFVEEVTYQTVVEARFKASALAVFFSMEDAAKAIPPIIGDAVAAAAQGHARMARRSARGGGDPVDREPGQRRGDAGCLHPGCHRQAQSPRDRAAHRVHLGPGRVQRILGHALRLVSDRRG